MPSDDKTVFDPGATATEDGKTVLDSAATVLETGAETVPDGGTTMLEAALSDAAERAAAPASSAAIVKGETILDTYRVESDAIEGGMGSVWRVHHTGWNVDLAMKRPQPQCFSTEKSKADFIHECEAWINLGLHPNIVSCYYVREISGTPSIFSEWMDGGSLESAIQKGTLYEGAEAAQRERLLDIAIQFARGLHYAHEAGLIHQDVKPDNVLLTKEGEAKVADFGLARARAVLTVLEGDSTMHDAADSGKTMLSPSGGYTPAYCSMEQMDGKPLTRRTDIYSWAVSVMEMYLGARPWANGVVAGLNCRSYFESARVALPEALKELLAQCLAGEPENRPQDFSEIEMKLREIYEAETGNAYPRPAPKAAADTADSLNNRALSFLDLGMPWKAEECFIRAKKQNASHSESVYNHALLKWRNGQIDDQSMIGICQELNWNESAHDKRKLIAAVHLERGDVENAMALHDGSVWSKTENAVIQDLLAQRKADRQQEVRFEKYYYASRLEKDQVVTSAPCDVNAVSSAALDRIGAFYAFNHRGDRLALNRKDNQKAYMLDMHTGDLSAECLCHDAQINDLVFSMDDRLIASGDWNGCIKVWDALTLACVTTIHTDKHVFALCFSADGKRLYSGGFSGEIKVWDARNGVLLKTLMSSMGDVRKLGISADSTRLISGNASVGQIWDTKTGKCMITLFHEMCNGKALLSADGSYAAVTRSRFFSESGSETFSVKHVPSSRYLADWMLCRITASARQIEADAAYEQYAEVALRQLDEDQPREALDTIAQARRLVGMRDDHFLLDLYAEAASRLKRGKLAHIWLRGSVPSANAHFCCIAVSPDSTRLFVLSQSGICVYSTDNQAKISEMPVKLPARINCACFDPSGRHLFIGSVDERSVTKIDVATGKKEGGISTKGIDHPTNYPKDLSISDCGKYLLISTAFSQHVYVYSVAACTLVARLASERFDMNGASMFYGGAYGISASQASGCNVRAIGLPAQLSQLVGSVGYPASRDHTKFIWFAGPRQLRVCSVEESAGTPVCIKGASDFSAACFTPDSKHVITADHSNAVTLWDASGVKEAELCRTVSRGHRLCVSLNGRYLAVQTADSSTQLVELEWATELPSYEDRDDILPHLKNFRVYQPYYTKDELSALERKIKSIGGGWISHADLTAMLLSIRPGRVLVQAPKGKQR